MNANILSSSCTLTPFPGGTVGVVNQGLTETGEPGGFRTLVQLGGPDGAMLGTTVSSGGTERQGFLYVPPAEEVLGWDANGNLERDSRWQYVWDDNNRLIHLHEWPLATMTNGQIGLEGRYPLRSIHLAYDHLGRRIAKTVWVLVYEPAWAPVWRLEKDLRYVYDGWQMIAELDHTFAPPTAGWQPGQTWSYAHLEYGAGHLNATRAQAGFGGFTGISGVAAERSVVRSYLWGQDVSGTMTGAGGVGGLLSVTHQGVTYHTCADANGNITGLLAANGADAGQLIARFDYDPFGNRITNTGPDVEICPMGFSTKYTDSETGLVDYGLRIYSPMMARWPSRDPIEEQGGVNLYGFVGNDPVNRVDKLGLQPILTADTKIVFGGYCGDFDWKINWVLSEPAPNGGYVIQHPVSKGEVRDCSGKIIETRNSDFWERWKIYPGQTMGKERRRSDWFRHPEAPCTRGWFEVEAHAEFYENPKFDDSWKTNNPDTYAGPLFSTTTPPTLPQPSSSNSVRRKLRIKWDCCNGRTPTIIEERK